MFFFFPPGHQLPNVSEEKVPTKQQEWSLNLDYDNLEPPQIVSDIWASQGGDDIMKFIFSPTDVKREHDQGQTQSALQLPTLNAIAGKGDHLTSTSTKQKTTEQDEDGRGVTGAASDCQPLLTDGSGVENESWNSGGDDDNQGDDDWEGGGRPQLAFKTLKAKRVKRKRLRTKDRKPRKSHLESSSPRNAAPHGCKVCGKTFTYITALKNHVQKHIKDTDFCGLCGEHFVSEESLRLHLPTHVAAKACELCGKHFGSHADMVKHLRIHTGEKPYLCSICGKGFHLNGNLNKHMRVHTGEKPFICTFCGRGFRQNVGLKYHLATHTGEKPHQCHICGKEFPMKFGLKHHLKIHSDERPYKCAVCGKGCYQSSHLKKHMLSHLRK